MRGIYAYSTYLRGARSPNSAGRFIMARPKNNPDSITRTNLVTRTVHEFTYKVRFVPNEGDAILTEETTLAGSTTSTVNALKKAYKARGTLLSYEVIKEDEGLYGATFEDYMKVAKRLDVQIKMEDKQ